MQEKRQNLMFAPPFAVLFKTIYPKKITTQADFLYNLSYQDGVWGMI
jgi:hypothetical protein